MSSPDAAPAARHRREMGAAMAAAGLAGALALSSAGQRWATVTALRPPPLPSITHGLTGGETASLVPAMGLLLLASAVALLAVRGAARSAVGLVMALAGGVLCWSGLRLLVGGAHATVADLPTAGGASVTGLRTSVAVGWPLVAVVGGLLAVLAGALVVLRGRGWPSMGRRYERPEGGAATAPATARELSEEERATAAWRALDRGEDPTVAPPPGEPGPSSR